MSSMSSELGQLVAEAFHTYRLYLESASVLNNEQIKLSLLKWPDIVQSAINYIDILEKKIVVADGVFGLRNRKLFQDEETLVKKVLVTDLDIAIVMPIRAIYNSVRQRVLDVTSREPADKVEECDDPIEFKNRLIVSINGMFGVLKIMTGVEYPVIQKRVE